MLPDLYSIWNTGLEECFPWRARLHGYIGQFTTKEAAERYVASVKHERGRSNSMAAATTDTTTKRK
jgi:hypothetical protein